MNISKKLFLSLVGLTSIILLVTLLLARWSFDQGFTEFINALEQQRLSRIATDVQQAYLDSNNQWDAKAIARVERDLFMHVTQLPSKRKNSSDDMFNNARPENAPALRSSGLPPPNLRPRAGRPPPHKATIDISTALFTLDGTQIAGPNIDVQSMQNAIVTQYDVMLQGNKIAQLKSWNNDKFGSSVGTQFSQQQVTMSLWIGGACLLLASVLSFYWSRALLAPIESVIHGIKTLSLGNYSLSIHHHRKDEFGSLIDDVNALAKTLEQTKTAKSRWFADISHELRTPLAVLLGEIEALQMGIRPLNKQNIQSLEQEAMLLKRLVDDLYQLSISDLGALRYELSPFDISLLAQRQCHAIEAQAQEANISVLCEIQDGVTFLGDETRIGQLLSNLLTNSLKYTDAGGTTRFTLATERIKGRQCLHISIEDSAPSVSEQDCDLLFEPLYRIEKSRRRDKGGAGLGLAICKNIVLAHKGEISAMPSESGGLLLRIALPMGSQHA